VVVVAHMLALRQVRVVLAVVVDMVVLAVLEQQVKVIMVVTV
jgi:hypothetical protein